MSAPPSGTPTSEDAAVRGALARVSGTDADDWFLVSKARHALLVVLRAVARHAGPGEVVTQPFTCATAVAPIVTAGLRPRYADLDPDTMALDPASVHAALSDRTRAVIAQHTFGRAARVARLRDLTPEGALLVEDSAHCLGELGRDADGVPAADVSVHSFGVEKMLPTRSGGAVWVNPALRGTDRHAVLVAALAGLPAPGRREGFARTAGTPARRVAGRLGGPGARALDVAANLGLVDLAIMPSERAGRVAGEPTALAGAALRDVARALPDLERIAEHRRRTAAIYRSGLAGVAEVTVPRLLDDPALTLVRYPMLLSTPGRAEAAFAALQAQGLVPGRWYRPVLFPGARDPRDFAYEPGTSPVAEDAAARVLNLQTATFVTAEAAQRAVDVVRGCL